MIFSARIPKLSPSIAHCYNLVYKIHCNLLPRTLCGILESNEKNGIFLQDRTKKNQIIYRITESQNGWSRKEFPTWYQVGSSSLFQSFLLLQWPGMDWDQRQRSIQYLAQFCVFNQQVPWLIQKQAHIFPSKTFAASVSAEAPLVALHVPHQIELHTGFVFPVFLYLMPLEPSSVTCSMHLPFWRFPFMFWLCQELLVHPHKTPATLAWLPAHWDGPFLESDTFLCLFHDSAFLLHFTLVAQDLVFLSLFQLRT